MFGKSVTLTVTGKVEEKGGNALSSVFLRLVDEKGQLLAEFHSQADGRFEFPAILDRQRYLLEISKSGFVTKRVEFIAVADQCPDNRKEDFKLKLSVELFKPQKNCTYAQYDLPIGTVRFSMRGCNKPSFEAKSPTPDCSDPPEQDVSFRKLKMVLDVRSETGIQIMGAKIEFREESGTLIQDLGVVSKLPVTLEGLSGVRNYVLKVSKEGYAPRNTLFVALGEKCKPEESKDREVKLNAVLVKKIKDCDYSAYDSHLCKVEFSPFGCMKPTMKCDGNPKPICNPNPVLPAPDSGPVDTNITTLPVKKTDQQILVADIHITEEEKTNHFIYTTDVIFSEEKSKRFRKIVYNWGAVYFQIDGNFTSEGAYKQELTRYRKK